MRKSGLDDPAQPISEAEVKANEQEKEKESNEPKDDEDPDVSEAMQQDPMQPDKKRIQYFSFINISDIPEEQKQNIKFNTESVVDVTDKFMEQLLPIGT